MDPSATEYYLGLDIGTSSVGWAVTDPSYNILDYRRKAMWGIHLFEEGKTAEDRRLHRCARRRLQRRRQRIMLLRELFSEEICKVDPGFYERLDESGLQMDDRRSRQPNSLFNDEGFNDKDFHKRFPTIYHLRKWLMHTDEKPDVRLVYLALHHIIKYRGHFLFATASGEEVPSFEEVLSVLVEDVNGKYGMDIHPKPDEVKRLLSDREMRLTDKKRLMYEALGVGEADEKKLADLLSGAKVNMSDLFSDEDIGKEAIAFRDNGAEDRMAELEDILDTDCFNTLRIAKQAYDWGVLTSLLRGCNSISEAMVLSYDQHRKDLALLKKTVKEYCPDRYNDLFKRKDVQGNYCSYSGVCGKGKPDKSCTQDEFCKYCRKLLEGTLAKDDPALADMLSRLENGTFMPKQTSRDNSVLPYTVHKAELQAILRNAARFYPFLEEVGDDGFTVSQKVEMIQEFRIPYYVGPTDTRSPRKWVVRRSFNRLTPWTYGDVIDDEASATAFMENLTNFCTYMVGEKVLPKNSVTYSYFMLYNELNNLRINGERISPDLKNRMVEDLFVGKDRKVTKKRIAEYLVEQGLVDKRDKDSLDIGGIDNEVRASLRSENAIRKIIGSKANDRFLCEDVIFASTVFGEPKRVAAKLAKDHGDRLTQDEIKALSKLKFEGWGRLSEKLLTGLYADCPETGQKLNIMGFLESTQYNLMEILERFGFNRQIEAHNRSQTTDGVVTYKTVDDMMLSPAVKRAVWRSTRIVREITEKMGGAPSRVFVETTRGEGEKKATRSRKAELLDLYKACQEDVAWVSELEGVEDSKLKARNLYLYYVQLGRCMYCGKKIDLEDINNSELVDRDHIYPQSKVKDDSLRSNMVLCHKACNMQKSDRFPLPPEWQQHMKPMWDELLRKKYISSEKHSRLIRTTPFSPDELEKFISRQLVETSQSAKATIEVLKRLLGEGTDIVYVKAGMVSEFRQFCDSPVTVKCRSVNDLHHAKDAYLNIVVGNVYDTKFTRDYRKFVDSGEKYNIRRLYDYPVSRGGVDAWVPGEDGTKATVLKYMRRNNVLFTKAPFVVKGAYFDEQPLRAKEDAGALIPRKEGLEPSRYGGYNNPYGACYSLVEYRSKGKAVRSLEVLPIFAADRAGKPGALEEYYRKSLGVDDVSVIVPVVRFNTLVEWNGVRAHIGGRTNDKVTLYNAVQMLMDDSWYVYCKKLFKFDEDRKNRVFRSEEYYGITAEQNMGLFNNLMSKVDSEPYCRMSAASSLYKNLVKVYEDFSRAEPLVQAEVLNEILHFFQCNAVNVNLKKVGGVGTTGWNLVNKKLPDRGKVKVRIVNQSITGLSESYIDLN